ncbi:MAG: acyl-CoA reductase [Bacteroidales bacterium]|nr:acyl-CoA reductase [Bacteroidales bacterium]
MLTLQQRIDSFAALGQIMKDAASASPISPEAKALRKVMDRQEENNKWFTPGNVVRSVEAIAAMLRKDRLESWMQAYDLKEAQPKKLIAVIMAGNIPLVGFHDFLCVLITGNKILARTSSKDGELIRAVADILKDINPDFSDHIKFSEKISGDYDAVIATGSDNTSRYFEYYFGHKPHIFRKNRNSVAIISRDTTVQDIEALGADIFSYYGLGCRNVSKIYFEQGLDINKTIKCWSAWSDIIKHRPYANNYLYNKSLFIVNKKAFLDNGYSLLVKNEGFSSPVSVVYYDTFSNREQLADELALHADKIQCIVSENNISFGQTQFPLPHEYADNKDTVEFLNALK